LSTEQTGATGGLFIRVLTLAGQASSGTRSNYSTSALTQL
jgi:hypothetical protein